MNPFEQAPWSGKQLAKLGKSLVNETPPPDGCPSYGEVMEWHSDLCADVAATIYTHRWDALDTNEFDITARAKTIDTLKQKLVREDWMKLNQVQDLAGVRVDADCSLQQQTAFAHEVVRHFNGADGQVKDLRDSPHSGYRAVHVWLRFPAGRVEVQIRTRGQSAWANAYEQLADTVGRQIRYGSTHDDPDVQDIVDYLHAESATLADLEGTLRDLVVAGDELDRAMASLGENLTVSTMELTTPESIAAVRLPDTTSRSAFEDLVLRHARHLTRRTEAADRITMMIGALASRMEEFQRMLDDQAFETTVEE